MNDSRITEMTDCDSELLLDTAQLAALIVLESGGEASRAEEIATIICRNGGRTEAEIIAMPTGIFLTVENENGHKMTSVSRIKSRSVNLCKVERANSYSREFSSGRLTLNELNEKLTSLRKSIFYSRPFTLLSTALSAAAFTLLFEDVLTAVAFFDLAVSFIASLLSQLVASSTKMKGSYQFTVTFISSSIMAVIACAAVKLIGIGNLNCIVIGAIMPLLPGLSLTNAIRDTVMGDILSGSVRLVETLLVAVGIAAGVGVVLTAYVNFFGGVV